jgi:hypothetical protein
MRVAAARGFHGVVPMRRVSIVFFALPFVLIAIAERGALAQSHSCKPNDTSDACMCAKDTAAPGPTTEFPLLYSPREHELSFEAGYSASSFPLKSALDLTLMYSFAPFDQRLQLGARIGMTAGRWGADDRGPVALRAGARVTGDFARPLSGILDIYTFLQGDVLLLAHEGDDVLRPELGLGLRAGRVISFEAGFAPLVSLGAPFTRGDSVAGGFAFGISLDFCGLGSACNESVPTSKQVDYTQQLYDAASNLTKDSIGTGLCKAVSIALDGARYAPHDSVDATEAFLRGVAANETDASVKQGVEELARKHAVWRQKLVDNRDAGLEAQANGRVILQSCTYAPLPAELRTAMGCDPVEKPAPAAPAKSP